MIGAARLVVMPRAASGLLALQIGARLGTFVLNQVLVRTASPAVFGAANVQLELVPVSYTHLTLPTICSV